jgi:hypothetical protein
MKMKQITVCISCKHEMNVIFPDDSPVKVTEYMKQQNYMVMIYTDSSACTPCSFKHLARWYSMKDKTMP